MEEKFFLKQLFVYSFLFRLAVSLFLYIFFYYNNGEPFEFDAGDSKFYHETGMYVADLFKNGTLNPFPELLKYMVISDTGFPIFVGFNYLLFFKSILLLRLVNVIFSAWTCVYVYKITKYFFDEKVAKLAAVLIMVVPSLMFYAGFHLKETFMIFLIVVAIHHTLYLTYNKTLNYWILVGFIVSVSALFLFRTVISLVLLFSITNHFFFFKVSTEGKKRKLLVGFWLIFMLVVLMFTSVKSDVELLLTESSTNQEQKLQSMTTASGNSLAQYASKSVLFPVLISAPFPTFVDTNQKNIMMFSGAMFVKNIYAFFVILALIQLFKHKLAKKLVLILTFVLGYLVIIGFSGFVLSDRFHQPLVPFYLVLAAFGINKLNKTSFNFFNYYLFLLGIIILGWNWVKLAGRGLY